MKKTRFTDEQMVTILREADRRPVPEVAKRHGVSAQTIYSWRKHFGTLEPADVVVDQTSDGFPCVGKAIGLDHVLQEVDLCGFQLYGLVHGIFHPHRHPPARL